MFLLLTWSFFLPNLEFSLQKYFQFPHYSFRVQENGEPLLNNDQRPNQNPSPHDAQEYDPVKEMIEQSWAEQQRQQQQQQQHRAPLQQQQSRQSQQNNQDSLSETNLAIALIAICVLHLVCQILRVFLAGLAVYLVFDTVYCMEVEQRFIPPLWTMCAESVSSILIMINASGKYAHPAIVHESLCLFFTRNKV